MKEFILRLNWSGFFLTWMILILASFMRENESLKQSFLFGSIIGFLGALIPLFVGAKDK